MRFLLTKPGYIRLTQDIRGKFDELYRYLTVVIDELQTALDNISAAAFDETQIGEWRVRKYGDGTAECDAEITIRTNGFTAWGNLYAAEGACVLPPGVFTGAPSVYATAVSASRGEKIMAAVLPQNANTGTVRFAGISGTAINKNTDFTLHLVARGRWR